MAMAGTRRLPPRARPAGHTCCAHPTGLEKTLPPTQEIHHRQLLTAPEPQPARPGHRGRRCKPLWDVAPAATRRPAAPAMRAQGARQAGASLRTLNRQNPLEPGDSSRAASPSAARSDRARGRAGVRCAAGGVRPTPQISHAGSVGWWSAVLKHSTTLQGCAAPGPFFRMGKGLRADAGSVTGRASGSGVVASGANTTDAPRRSSIA